jgi:ABC-type transporter Mla subunit MlaD
LVFTPGTLDSIRATAARLAIVTAPLADTSRSLLGRLKLDTLEAGVTRAASSADRMLTRIDSVAAKAGGLLDTLRPAFVTARDSLPRLIGNANGLTTQGTEAARGVKRWLPPFLIGGTGAALAAILKLIGVF